TFHAMFWNTGASILMGGEQISSIGRGICVLLVMTCIDCSLLIPVYSYVTNSKSVISELYSKKTNKYSFTSFYAALWKSLPKTNKPTTTCFPQKITSHYFFLDVIVVLKISTVCHYKLFTLTYNIFERFCDTRSLRISFQSAHENFSTLLSQTRKSKKTEDMSREGRRRGVKSLVIREKSEEWVKSTVIGC
uniref:Uncharacterized protein n=1 Tax=Terrapene triunguis TaxID=2587831 RepID=A0A674K0J2_9SAUR